MTDKIKLNLNCPICNGSLFIKEELAHTKNGVYHLKCYIKDERQQTLKDIDKWLKERTYKIISNEEKDISIIRFMPFEWEDFKKELEVGV